MDHQDHPLPGLQTFDEAIGVGLTDDLADIAGREFHEGRPERGGDLGVILQGRFEDILQHPGGQFRFGVTDASERLHGRFQGVPADILPDGVDVHDRQVAVILCRRALVRTRVMVTSTASSRSFSGRS